MNELRFYTLAGAVGGVSTNLEIVTAATNQNTRQPMVTAAFAVIMHRLTGGRFSLSIRRGIKPIFDAFGLPGIKTAEMEGFAVSCAASGRATSFSLTTVRSGNSPLSLWDPIATMIFP
jgi:hypothetical protein